MSVVLISGGTGLIGTKLTHYLTDNNYEVIILSRDKNRSSDNPKISYAFWDVQKQIIDAEVLKKADHIIHLAGAGVMNKKWTGAYKKEIIDSRTKSAGLLIKSLKDNEHHVKTFVSASAIGYYGADDQPLTRNEGFIESDLADKNFLGETCVLWEASVEPAMELGMRLVKIRTGIVLSNEGGAFKEFKMPLKFGVAAILGNGKQILSWIHIDDLCRIYTDAIANSEMSGVYNGVAPSPVSNKKLMLATAEKFRNKFFIPIHVPTFLLKLFMGEKSIEILKSATVSAKKIKSTGFTFLYPTIEAAIEELAAK